MPAFGSEGHVGLGTDGASPLERVELPIDGQISPTSRAGELDAHLLEGRADAVGTDLRVLRKLLDSMNGLQVSFSELSAGVRAICESRQLLLGKVPEDSMHGVAAHLEVASDGLGIPSLRVQLDDHSTALEPIGDVSLPRMAACGRRWLGAHGQ
jgi:hypothetical protein